MNASASIQIHCDATSFEVAIRGLIAQLANRPVEVRERFLRRFDAIAQPFRCAVVHQAATGSMDVLVDLQPSAALLDLVSALWAGEFDVE